MAKQEPIVRYGEVKHLYWSEAAVNGPVSPEADAKQGDEQRSAVPATDAMHEQATAAVNGVAEHKEQIVLG